MKDMCLPTYDKLVVNVCNIMTQYITGEAKFSDRHEKHFGFEVAFNSIIGANMALLGDASELTQRYKKLCAYYIEESYGESNVFMNEVWDKKNYDNYDFMLSPETIHILWFLYENPYLKKTTLQHFISYLWNRDKGVYYLYGQAISKHVGIEDNYFIGWLYALEHFSLVSNLKDVDLIVDKTTDLNLTKTKVHLINQGLKLINKEASVPKSGPVFGHYHESWRRNELSCCDMVLRIARVIVRL